MADPALRPSPGVPATITSKQESLKARYAKDLDAWLEVWKQEASDRAVATALDASRADVDRASEAALLTAVHEAYLATTQSSLDRALTRVNVVTASIGAITTIYTGLLALVYAAKAGDGQRLDIVALIPALFLGTALFLVTIYAAMLRRSLFVGPLLPTGIGGQIAEQRLITFMQWCFAGVLARTWALHAGIVSMGVGVATLPIPFVKLGDTAQAIIFTLGIAAVGLTGATTWYRTSGSD
ncbi:MAG TPA: hypothetical protein VM097_11375 [Mycobacteriales bacterium]|nr:hypothetical protein [Mycobacteriales bacterium]